MIGAGGPDSGAAPAIDSLAIKGSGGNGGNPLDGSISIDFTPITFSPKAEAAMSALPFASVTASFKRSFLTSADFSSETEMYAAYVVNTCSHCGINPF